MMAGILVLAIIGLGVINTYLYYTIKYNTKGNSIFKYIIPIAFIVLLAHCAFKEDKVANQIIYFVGTFMILWQLLEWIVEEAKHKKDTQLIRLNNYLLLASYGVEERGEEYTEKLNKIFKVLSENASHGTILLLNGIKEENTTLLFLIKNTNQLSEFKEVCEMVGKCKYYGKNEKRRRFAMSCKL